MKEDIQYCTCDDPLIVNDYACEKCHRPIAGKTHPIERAFDEFRNKYSKQYRDENEAVLAWRKTSEEAIGPTYIEELAERRQESVCDTFIRFMSDYTSWELFDGLFRILPPEEDNEFLVFELSVPPELPLDATDYMSILDESDLLELVNAAMKLHADLQVFGRKDSSVVVHFSWGD